MRAPTPTTSTRSGTVPRGGSDSKTVNVARTGTVSARLDWGGNADLDLRV